MIESMKQTKSLLNLILNSESKLSILILIVVALYKNRIEMERMGIHGLGNCYWSYLLAITLRFLLPKNRR